ncbi:MAG TPA: zinc-ribbon domain-containing protein [Pirellulales bacterium]|nr:zinc-ribbon domain-containing protein [Pirellulales bacterium]
MLDEWDWGKNNKLGITPYNVTAGCNKKAHWKCSVAEDHRWESAIINRALHDSGCLCCAGKKAVTSNSLATTHPHIAAEWDHERNGSLTPYDVVGGCNKKAHWQCQKGHRWHASIANRTNLYCERGCPQCIKWHGEEAIARVLADLGIKYERQWRVAELGQKRFDFCAWFPERRTEKWFIEFHGGQHYLGVSFSSDQSEAAKLECFEYRLRCDWLKGQATMRQHQPVLVIPFWEFRRIEEILKVFARGEMPTFSEPPPIVKKYEPLRKSILRKIRSNYEDHLPSPIISAAR